MFAVIINFLFPKICPVTQEEGSYLSKEGKKELIAHHEICPVSHRFSRDFRTLPGYSKNFFLTGVHICFSYSSYIKKLILRLKYYHQRDLIDTFVDRMILHIQTNTSLWQALQSGSCCLTYIPSHRRRHYFVKGYNQSLLLAECLAKRLNVPCLQLAEKKYFTKSQTSLSRDKRIDNVANSFSLCSDCHTINYKTIVIVDDLITTGATINTVAQLFASKRKKSSIRGLVIARHDR